jgi:hypothetical protein
VKCLWFLQFIRCFFTVLRFIRGLFAVYLRFISGFYVLFAIFMLYSRFLRYISGSCDLFVVFAIYSWFIHDLFVVFAFYSWFLCFIHLQLKYLDNLRACGFSKSYFDGLIFIKRIISYRSLAKCLKNLI